MVNKRTSFALSVSSNARTACLLLACWIALLVLPACTTQALPTPRADSDIVVAVPQGDPADALTFAAAAYTRATGERVRVVKFGLEAYSEAVSAALLAGLDRYDLVYLPAEDLPQWAAYHAIRSFSLPIERAPLAPWLAAVTVDGDLYGLPVRPDPLVLWYRADLLSAQGLPVPADWAAFRQAALALNAPPGRYGAVVAGDDLNAGLDFAAVLAGYGVRAVSDTDEVQLDSDAARQALRLYAGLRRPDGVVPPAADHYARPDVIAALGQGKAAMGLAPLSAAAGLRDCKKSPKVCQAGSPLLAWANLPGLAAGTALGSLDAWALPRHAAQPAAAERFAVWLSSADGARAWIQGGSLAAHLGALDSSPAALGGAAAWLAQVHFYQLPFPAVTTVDLLWNAGHAAAHAAIAGEQPPDQAIQTAAQQMRLALRQGGSIK